LPPFESIGISCLCGSRKREPTENNGEEQDWEEAKNKRTFHDSIL
jgi:hypothetical protein